MSDACSVIVCVCRTVLSDITMTAQAAAVAEGTVRSTYKDMYVYMAELVPTWFASQKELQRLPNAT